MYFPPAALWMGCHCLITQCSICLGDFLGMAGVAHSQLGLAQQMGVGFICGHIGREVAQQTRLLPSLPMSQPWKPFCTPADSINSIDQDPAYLTLGHYMMQVEVQQTCSL